MDSVMYQFGLEDRVLCSQTDIGEPCLPGVVVDRQPRGGGPNGKDPLYVVQLDQPLGASYTSFFSKYNASSQIISFHGNFLKMLEQYTVDDEDLTGLVALL